MEIPLLCTYSIQAKLPFRYQQKDDIYTNHIYMQPYIVQLKLKQAHKQKINPNTFSRRQPEDKKKIQAEKRNSNTASTGAMNPVKTFPKSLHSPLFLC